MTEISVETMGPKGEVKTDKVSPVSTRKEMDLPAAWSITLGLGEGDGNHRVWVPPVFHLATELKGWKSLRCLQ